MKYLIVVFMAAAVVAEPPISKSYLPPSRSGQGYPQGPQSSVGPSFAGAPEVIAARSFGQGRENIHANHGNNFARNNLHDHGAAAEGYDSAFGRNGETGEPASYNFGYMVNDYAEGTDFGHHEERQEERAQGQYHVVLPDGRKQTVSYEADERGFKPRISYQDTEDLANSRYDSNANTRSNYQNGAHSNHGNGAHGNGFHDNHGNGVHGNARSNGY